MYFRFCKPSFLKWQYRIYAFSCFKFITGLWPRSFFFTRNKLLANSPFDCFTNSSPSGVTIVWEEIFDRKGFEWNGILCPFTLSKILESCVNFIQAPTKCFNLPDNRAFGIVFNRNNLFNNEWTYLDSHWIGFCEFKSMLKKVCCGVVIPTIYVLQIPCMSVVGMTLLLLLLLVTIMEFFRSDFCEKKTFAPHIFLVLVRD